MHLGAWPKFKYTLFDITGGDDGGNVMVRSHSGLKGGVDDTFLTSLWCHDCRPQTDVPQWALEALFSANHQWSKLLELLFSSNDTYHMNWICFFPMSPKHNPILLCCNGIETIDKVDMPPSVSTFCKCMHVFVYLQFWCIPSTPELQPTSNPNDTLKWKNSYVKYFT